MRLIAGAVVKGMVRISACASNTFLKSALMSGQRAAGLGLVARTADKKSIRS